MPTAAPNSVVSRNSASTTTTSSSTTTFSIHEALWQECWVAATSSLRGSKKRALQVDFNIRQRVEMLLEEHGPNSASPLTLRIYGTMLKGFCILNNDRARSLHADCERLVVAFVQRPLADSSEQITLPTTKKRKQVDALTLDLDIAKVREAEAFHWLQAAPLSEGSVLRLTDGPTEHFSWTGEAPSLVLPSLLSQNNFLDESFPALVDGPEMPPLKLPRVVGPEGADGQMQQQEQGEQQQQQEQQQEQQPEQQQQHPSAAVPAGPEAQEQLLEHVGQQVRLLQPDVLGAHQVGAVAPANDGGVRKWRRIAGGPGIVYGFDEDTTFRVAMQADPDDPRALDPVLNFRSGSSGRVFQLASLLPREVPEHIGLLDVLIAPQLEGQRFRGDGGRKFGPQMQAVLAAGAVGAPRLGEELGPGPGAVGGGEMAPGPGFEVGNSDQPSSLVPLLDPSQMAQSGSDDTAEQVADALRQHLEKTSSSNAAARATCSFRDFVPRSVTRGVAALTFHSILTLATNGDILVDQLESFGSISLSMA